MADPLPILTTDAQPDADASLVVSPPSAWAPKLAALRAILREGSRWLVAFSGGVDSVLLLAIAVQERGADVLALTAVSPTLPDRELQECRRIARNLGARLLEVRSGEMEVESFASNPPDRCFFCKAELFRLAREQADLHGCDRIADGANADDLSDHRPGLVAADRAGVLHPFVRAGMGKADIRGAARALGLAEWSKPAFACLSSRLPYGTRITSDRLAMIERVEDALHDLGFPQVRVRHHGEVCRIELPPAWIDRAAVEPIRSRVARAAIDAGFTWAALDLQGYRPGSMNRVLGADGDRPRG